MVKDLWWEWVALVEWAAYNARSGTRLPLAPDRYRRLHDDLMRALQQEADSAGEGQREVYLELASWVQPWLTLEALARTDQDILNDLTRRCRHAGSQLGIRPRRPIPWIWLVGLTLASLLVSLAVFTYFGQESTLSWSREAQRAIRTLQASGRAAGYEHWLGAALFLVFVYALWPVRRI